MQMPLNLTVPSTVLGSPGRTGRSRGFSAPGPYPPLGGQSWGSGGYPRQALPPLTVPSDPPPLAHGGVYGGSHSAHPGLHPISPADEHPQSATAFSPSSYGSAGMQYGYSTADSQSSWSMSPTSASSSQQSTGSLSSLLNPSGGQYSRPLQSTYPGAFSGVSVQGNHSTSSVSPDSRPTTGYSLSSVSSLPYDTESTSMSHDYSRPSSGHHRPLSPPRPHSSHKIGGVNAMSSGYPSSQGYISSGSAIRRQRRHSQAMSPYPSPYDNGAATHNSHHLDSPAAHGMHHRPSTSPQPTPLTPGAEHPHHAHHAHAGHHPTHQGISRVRSMVQLPAVDTTGQGYGGFGGAGGGEFAYSAGGGASASGGQQSPATGHLSSVDAMDWNRGVRPSTSTSSLSAASHASSSQANTPPVDQYGAGEDINRCE